MNILRVKRSGIWGRHQHTGPVHTTTLTGRWHYVEHDWWADEGGYSFEPPGETHTLEVPEGCEYMATLFHITDAYIVSHLVPFTPNFHLSVIALVWKRDETLVEFWAYADSDVFILYEKLV